METMQGVIEALGKDGKRFKIGDKWYSCFAASSVGGAGVGDEVKFAFVENNKDGTIYNNVKGSVTVKTKGAGASASAPSVSRSASNESPERNMSIIRQNALTNAVSFYNARQTTTTLKDKTAGIEDLEDGIATVITIAEAFSTFASGEYAERKKRLEAHEANAQVNMLERVSKSVAV